MTQCLEGGCLCGAVRYRARRVLDTGYCDCATCRRAHGAPATAWANADADDFELLQGIPSSFASPEHGRRFFCSECGSQLFFRQDDGSGHVSLTVGTLDDPNAVAPAPSSHTRRSSATHELRPAAKRARK